MSRRIPRVIYLSSSNSNNDLLNILRGLRCEIVYEQAEDYRVSSFPDYDIGISFMYLHRIPATEFDSPYKWVNFHPAPLPELRGRNLAYQAIVQCAPQFGASLHYMDAEFDSGEIIEVVRFPIRPHHTAGDLTRLSHGECRRLFEKYVPSLLAGKVPSTPQGKGKYYPKNMIDDNIEVTSEQSRRIRAVTVYPKFFPTMTIGGEKYKIVRCHEDT